MTDTKHELPTIDWTKPVEAKIGDTWYVLDAVMRKADGTLYITGRGNAMVCTDQNSFQVDPSDIRNKPEPLECWVNVYPGGPGTPHETKHGAIIGARRDVIRRAVLMREVVEND